MRALICISSVLLTFAQEDAANNHLSFAIRNMFKEHEEMKKGSGFGVNPFLKNGQFKREPVKINQQVCHFFRTGIITFKRTICRLSHRHWAFIKEE